jgi:hypothetical protein
VKRDSGRRGGNGYKGEKGQEKRLPAPLNKNPCIYGPDARTSKLCPRHLGHASYQYRPVADPGVKWRMHLQPAEVWLIESVYIRQHQLGSIDAAVARLTLQTPGAKKANNS